MRGATGSVSYREFDILANRLANRLLALGVRPGEPVAVSCESGLGLVVALHGVMKSGAAYVALDPLAPTARREHAHPTLAAHPRQTRAAHGDAVDR